MEQMWTTLAGWWRGPYRAAVVVGGAVIAATLAVKLFGVFTFPVHVDANYYLNIAINAIHYGDLTPRMWRLPADSGIIAGSGTGYGILLLTTWMQAFGISILSGRLLMVLLGLVFAVGMVGAVWAWWRNPFAAAAAGLFALVSASPFFAFQVRMDTAGFAAYAFILWGVGFAHSRPHPRWHALVGAGLVAAAEFHILAVLYIVGLTFVYAVEYGAGAARARRLPLDTPFAWYALGGAVAGALYIAVHILPNPAAYFLIPANCPDCVPASPGKEWVRLQTLFGSRPVEAVLVALGGVAAAVRRTPADRRLLLLMAGLAGAYPLVSPPTQIEYTTHMAPVFVMLMATLIVYGFRAASGFPPRRALLLHAVLLVALSLQAARVWLVRGFGDTPPPPVVAIHAYDLPPDTVIVGEFIHFHRLLGYWDYVATGPTDIYALTLYNEDYPAYWRRIAPDAVIAGAVTPPSLYTYMEAEGFREVVPDLWLSQALCARVNCDAPPPT